MSPQPIMRKERKAISAFLLLRKASHSMREPAAEGGGKAKTNDSVAKGGCRELLCD